MTRHWNPRCSLSLGSGSTAGYVARFAYGDGPKIDFEIESHTLQTPDQATIVVSNAPPDVAAKVQKEFTDITLWVGYDDDESVIFHGSIIESQYGERTDEFTTGLLRLWAADSDPAYGNAQVNATLPAGSTHKDIVDKCAEALKPYGVGMGQIVGVDLGKVKFPRAVTLSSMVRDVLRRTCLANGATYTLSGGELNVLAKNASGTGSSGIVLSPSTGLVGQVIQRPEGVIANCLIDPAIKVNTTVRIEADVISPNVTPNAIVPGSTDRQTQLQNQLNANGDYRVLHMLTRGSTRGEEWTMTLTTLGVGQNTNVVQAGLGYN